MLNTANPNNKEFRKGNPKAFKLLFYELYNGLYKYALHFVGQPELSEELVQEAFLAIWEKRKLIVDTFNIKAYLYKSIHNQALNYLRHQKIVNQHVNEISFSELAENATREPNPFLSQALNEAIANLPDRMRLVFQMSRIYGMHHREISDKLGITEKTVEVHIRKARIMLRKKLKPFYNEL